MSGGIAWGKLGAVEAGTGMAPRTAPRTGTAGPFPN